MCSKSQLVGVKPMCMDGSLGMGHTRVCSTAMAGNGMAGWLRSDVVLELVPTVGGLSLDDPLRLVLILRPKLPKKLEDFRLSPEDSELRDEMEERRFRDSLSFFRSFFAGPRVFL